MTNVSAVSVLRKLGLALLSKCQEESRAYLVTGGAAKNISTADMVVSLDGTYSKIKFFWNCLMFSEEERN
jgi:hypothetical protein